MKPFLNRLKAIDKQVSVLPPEGPSNTWCYEDFIREFKRITNEQFKEIKYIMWYSGSYSADPKVQAALVKLQEFWVANCSKGLNEYLKGLPQEKSAFKLSELEKINQLLENFNIAVIVNKINDSHSKATLDLSETFITRIPDSLIENKEYQDYWQNLQNFYCWNNAIKCLPDALSQCQKLRYFNCNNNRLKTLPESLGNCHELFSLSCNNNEIDTLPESLGNCKKLELLSCNNNKLQILPDALVNCPLQSLYCTNNKLINLPFLFESHQALKTLHCAGNQLQYLSEDLGKCQSLEIVDCSYNELRSIPESLGKCQKLKYFNCDSNQLKSLPASLANCPLQEFHCLLNYITYVAPNLRRKAQSCGFYDNWYLSTIKQQKYYGGLLVLNLPLIFCGLLYLMGLLPVLTIITCAVAGLMLAGLILAASALKTAILRFKQSPQIKLLNDTHYYKKQFAILASKFTTTTSKAYVKSLQALEKPLTQEKKISFLQFEIHALKKVNGLVGLKRTQTQAAFLDEAKKRSSLYREPS
ncbi:MAG: leucine-rich repeat domain-containing protein [Proteobacteria bacterium]|nr:leucine-rich repeat domain-containing protein [Pseudomonadota bacterium]